jgi:TolA-binding protein
LAGLGLLAVQAASGTDERAGERSHEGRDRVHAVIVLCGVPVMRPSSFGELPIVVRERRDQETRYPFGRRPDGGAQLVVSEKGKDAITAPRVDKAMRVPAEDLQDGRLDEAVAGYRKLKESNPSDPAVAEQRFNRAGYQYLQKKDYARAIAVFRLNTQLYPDSANTYDSLGEALEGSGDKAGAIAMYRKTLEVAAKHGEAGQNGDAKAHAEARLKELGTAP